MMNIFAELKVNPFADDVVSEPRRVSYSVEGLNATPLQRLIDEFHELTVGDLPRKPAVGRKARLVVSPDRGYGKSHLLGRLFQALGDQATLIYLRPFQDPQRVWISILLATVQELERPNQDGTATQLEAFSKGVLAHVAADQLARVPLGNVSQVQDAVKSLRAHPLKVLGQTSTVLIRWLKSRFDDRAELGKLGALLREREINLAQRETAWLKVLAGYAFTLFVRARDQRAQLSPPAGPVRARGLLSTLPVLLRSNRVLRRQQGAGGCARQVHFGLSLLPC